MIHLLIILNLLILPLIFFGPLVFIFRKVILGLLALLILAVVVANLMPRERPDPGVEAARTRYLEQASELPADLKAKIAHGNAQLEADAKRQKEIDATLVKEAEVERQRWNQAQGIQIPVTGQLSEPPITVTGQP